MQLKRQCFPACEFWQALHETAAARSDNVAARRLRCPTSSHHPRHRGKGEALVSGVDVVCEAGFFHDDFVAFGRFFAQQLVEGLIGFHLTFDVNS